MLKFIEKNKKLLTLIAACVIALAWLRAAWLLFGRFTVASNIRMLIYDRNFPRELVVNIAWLIFAVGGFLQWKKGKNYFLIPAGSALLVSVLGIELILALIRSFVCGRAIVFFQKCVDAGFPFLLFAFILVFSFVKIKGPVVPLIGGAAGILMAVAFLFTGIHNFVNHLVNVQPHILYMSGFDKFIKGCEVLLSFGYIVLFYLGLAVLVFLFLWERCNPVEEIAEEAAERAEEVPVAEEV